MNLKHFFCEHPNSVGETYYQHLRASLRFSSLLFLAAMASLIHALLPSVFVRTASGIINKLYSTMVLHRRVRSAEQALSEN